MKVDTRRSRTDTGTGAARGARTMAATGELSLAFMHLVRIDAAHSGPLMITVNTWMPDVCLAAEGLDSPMEGDG
ncbi:hypothetical protein JOF56_009001 [Kibdelosporangium banguiense]|uniref:Uncharacterized protein n=1 Tax=Kibdelosporangium banguiense TaxID=1365924 RepID=A0ABS4TXF5_9PSEU|nr:hypothetical protein [Kibdelosporangium banguiense]